MVVILHFRFSNKKLILYGLIVLLLVWLLLILWQNLEKNVEDIHHHLDLDDIKKLLSISNIAGVPIILFDLFIFETLSDNKFDNTAQKKECNFICQSNRPLSFAVFSNHLNDNPYFLGQLAQTGFTVTKFFNSNNSISHIFILHNGSLLHITVLYWQNAGYWRQFALKGDSHHLNFVKEYLSIDSWNIISVDRSFKSFDTEKAVIDGVELSVPKDIIVFTKIFKGSHFIPCNTTQANLYYLKYNELSNVEVKRFQHQAWKLLAKCKTLLDKLNISFWISSGTCLGYFRQCDIIPWALDIDLGIFIEDFNNELISEFEKKDLKLVHQFGKPEDSFELSFKENNDLKVDLFFFYTEGASMWNGGTQVKTGKKFKYTFPAFTLCWTEFLELLVRIPCQIKDYIEANYGPNWMHPVKNWDWKSSPSNVEENGVWPSEERDKVIIIKDI